MNITFFPFILAIFTPESLTVQKPGFICLLFVLVVLPYILYMYYILFVCIFYLCGLSRIFITDWCHILFLEEK